MLFRSITIGKRIIRKTPEITVVINSEIYHPSRLNPALQHLPLLNIYLVNPPPVLPARGKTLFVKAINKLEQYQHYILANISTPKTIEYEIGQDINTKEWGEYVFLKDKNESHGRNSFLIPTKEIKNIKPYLDKLKIKSEILDWKSTRLNSSH